MPVPPVPLPQRDHGPSPSTNGTSSGGSASNGSAAGVALDVVRQLLAAVHRHPARRLLVRTADFEVEIEHAGPTGVPARPVEAGGEPDGGEPDGNANPALVDVPAPAVGVVRFGTGASGSPGPEVGAVVGAEDEVAQVEAMKMTTPVLAGRAGTIREVCVHDGDVVGFGEPLLRLEPARQDGGTPDGAR
ncbi:acetyl-CoA carboxylase biotin carboxyl carrier protein [Saccharothrix sp. Mg75]|uniref:acetyl-CoA carboxylase biotin carboxyl carrier protein n=1 Tax=Saccharothrix sp. Mg75 TaxID=3445357 RepID=UPI003EE9828B